MSLVLGSSGQATSELKRLPGAVVVGRPDIDFCNLASISDLIQRTHPLAVVNAAAYTAVDATESEADLAQLINASAPGEVACVCGGLDIPPVQISTEYVFDGIKTYTYFPYDDCNTQGGYEASKRAGEEAIMASSCQRVILQTSWVFLRYGSNFVKTMLKLGQERGQLSAVSDQIGGPTSANAIAQCFFEIAHHMVVDKSIRVIFHFCGVPQVSWFEFTNEIFRMSDLEVNLVPIATNACPTRARQFWHSVLDCQSTKDAFGVVKPDWRVELSRVIKELGEANV